MWAGDGGQVRTRLAGPGLSLLETAEDEVYKRPSDEAVCTFHAWLSMGIAGVFS